MKKFKRVVVLTGAGISAESGIKTFRAADGLWEDHHIEDVATFAAFERDPALVQRFYNTRRRQLLGEERPIEPNAAHRALADYEHRLTQAGGQFTLITQNIDDLHERAGSQNLLHMHGQLLKQRCLQSGEIFECMADMGTATSCPCCQQSGNLRPHIVWFGEMPLYMDSIEKALGQCDLFIAIGTSGNVYPAAGFFQQAQYAGAHTVEINLDASNHGSQFAEQRRGKATELLPDYLARLLSHNP